MGFPVWSSSRGHSKQALTVFQNNFLHFVVRIVKVVIEILSFHQRNSLLILDAKRYQQAIIAVFGHLEHEAHFVNPVVVLGFYGAFFVVGDATFHA